MYHREKHKFMMVTMRMYNLKINGSGIGGNHITLMILKDQITETGMRAHTDKKI